MTPEPRDPRAEIIEVACKIEDLAASREGPLKTTLDLCVRRLCVALLLGDRLVKAIST